MKTLIKKALIRLLKKMCDYNAEELLLYRELTAWQDIHDKQAPSAMKRPIYPNNDVDYVYKCLDCNITYDMEEVHNCKLCGNSNQLVAHNSL